MQGYSLLDSSGKLVDRKFYNHRFEVDTWVMDTIEKLETQDGYICEVWGINDDEYVAVKKRIADGFKTASVYTLRIEDIIKQYDLIAYDFVYYESGYKVASSVYAESLFMAIQHFQNLLGPEWKYTNNVFKKLDGKGITVRDGLDSVINNYDTLHVEEFSNRYKLVACSFGKRRIPDAFANFFFKEENDANAVKRFINMLHDNWPDAINIGASKDEYLIVDREYPVTDNYVHSDTDK